MKRTENKLVWVKFMIGDYLKYTQGLTLLQQGIYIKYMLYCFSIEPCIKHEKRYDIIGYSGEISKAKQQEACDEVLQAIFERQGNAWVSPYFNNMKTEAEKCMRNTEAARAAKQKKAELAKSVTETVTEDVAAVVTDAQSELHPQKQLQKKKEITSSGSYDIGTMITGETILKIRKLCPTDTYDKFIELFNRGVADGTLEKPTNPNKAIVAWFKIFVPKYKGEFAAKTIRQVNKSGGLLLDNQKGS